MKVALVCDWLTSRGGAEKVILALHKIYPQAPIYTTVYNSQNFPEFKNAKIITSFLQNFPLAKTKYPYYLPLMPKAIESFNLKNYDLIVSSSHACAKGAIKKEGAIHICYCHTPMRYAWQIGLDDRARGKFKEIILNKIRIWDKNTTNRVDYFVTNSANVQKRILKFYQRQSHVIYPPVDTDFFKLNNKIKQENFYLFVSRLIPYKKADLAIEAFNKLKLPLKIVGSGPQLLNLKKIANNNIQFLGRISDEKLRSLYWRAQAVIFPAEEDFGIVPVEAQSAGCPVIAYGAGGALETVIDGQTGILFKHQTVDSLTDAVEKFQKIKFNKINIRNQVLKFSKQLFRKNWLKFTKNILKNN